VSSSMPITCPCCAFVRCKVLCKAGARSRRVLYLETLVGVPDHQLSGEFAWRAFLGVLRTGLQATKSASLKRRQV
jgi:hypothetical protein